MKRVQDQSEKLDLIGFFVGLAALAALAFGTTGCALASRGTELKASVGLYGVDEHEEKSRMHYRPPPLICWVRPSACAPQHEEVQVS